LEREWEGTFLPFLLLFFSVFFSHFSLFLRHGKWKSPFLFFSPLPLSSFLHFFFPPCLGGGKQGAGKENPLLSFLRYQVFSVYSFPPYSHLSRESRELNRYLFPLFFHFFLSLPDWPLILISLNNLIIYIYKFNNPSFFFFFSFSFFSRCNSLSFSLRF